MCSEPDVSFIVPSNDPHSGTAFPPRGPRGEFPRFPGTARCSDSLPPSGRASSPSRAVPRWARSSLPGEGSPPAWVLGLVTRVPTGIMTRRGQGLPGSWASPMRACPAPGPRWNLRVWPRSRRGDAVFRCCDGVDFHGAQLSGLTHAACALPVYASQRRLPDQPRNTRFRLVASLCRAGLATRRDAQRVSELAACSGEPHDTTWIYCRGTGRCSGQSDLVEYGEPSRNWVLTNVQQRTLKSSTTLEISLGR
jgi:hypothetical protein